MLRKSYKKLKSLLIIFTILFLLSFLLWWNFFRTIETIRTETITKGDIKNVVTALGVLQPHRYVDIGAQVSGQIKHIAVRAGDKVKKGDLLVEIDPSLQKATVQTNQATLANLKAQLKEQEASYELSNYRVKREEQMWKNGATKLEDVQTAQINLKIAKARIESLEAQIKGALSTLQGNEALLGYTKIYASMDGTVITLNAKEGQTLNATYQTPKLLKIADLSKMIVWAEVSEADMGRLKLDMDVYFTTLGLKEKNGELRIWNGKLKQILPAPVNNNETESSKESISSKVVNYTALFDVQNSDETLMSQMSAQVFFVESSAKNVLLAPLHALKEIENNTYLARVLINNQIEQKKVILGTKDRLFGEIKEGLQQNDQLITKIEKQQISQRLTW